MNTQLDALPESSDGSLAIAPAEIPALRHMYWALRRELWENHAIYVAPLAIAAVILFGSLISTMVCRTECVPYRRWTQRASAMRSPRTTTWRRRC